MKLYYHPLSGHAHRARLFISLLGIDAELIEVDLAARAHKSPDFLKLNPFGQVPVLDDAGDIIGRFQRHPRLSRQEAWGEQLAARRPEGRSGRAALGYLSPPEKSPMGLALQDWSPFSVLASMPAR